jgi:hypothetical protein
MLLYVAMTTFAALGNTKQQCCQALLSMRGCVVFGLFVW